MSSRSTSLFAAALVLAMNSASAQALLEGNLELRWGDPAPGSAEKSRFEVDVVGERGTRTPLDANRALIAAGDLYRLNGRAVALTAQPAPWLGGLMTPETLVDADTTKTMDTLSQPGITAVTGSQPWVTLLCKFSDIATEQKPLSYFGTMLSNTTGRLDNYWREVSYNKANVAGSQAYGWFTLPSPRSTYITTDSNGTHADLGKLFNDCTAKADATVNFSTFVGVNTMYNGDLDGFAWGGGRGATLDGTTKYWYVTWEPPWGYANEAPLAHEMGHGFGLPHANNLDGDDDPYDNPWDVMSDAWDNAAGDATFGTQPKHINTWSRDHLGWIDAARKLTIAADGVTNGIKLDRASLIGSTNVQMIKVTLPGEGADTHYYTIEARKKVGYYEANLAGDAVIIHEVNTSWGEPSRVVDTAVPVATVSNKAGSMFVVGENYVAPNNAFRVDVTGTIAEGFTLNVRRGAVADDVIFKSGFQ